MLTHIISHAIGQYTLRIKMIKNSKKKLKQMSRHFNLRGLNISGFKTFQTGYSFRCAQKKISSLSHGCSADVLNVVIMFNPYPLIDRDKFSVYYLLNLKFSVCPFKLLCFRSLQHESLSIKLPHFAVPLSVL